MKRSSNLENLVNQRQFINEKIQKLQITLKGIEKSIDKIEKSNSNKEEVSEDLN